MSDNREVQELTPCSDGASDEVAGDNAAAQAKFSSDSTTKVLELTKIVEAKEITIELFQAIILRQQIMLQFLSIQIATDQRKEALRQYNTNSSRKRKIDHEKQESPQAETQVTVRPNIDKKRVKLSPTSPDDASQIYCIDQGIDQEQNEKAVLVRNLQEITKYYSAELNSSTRENFSLKEQAESMKRKIATLEKRIEEDEKELAEKALEIGNLLRSRDYYYHGWHHSAQDREVDIRRLLEGSEEYRKSREGDILRKHEVAVASLKAEHYNEINRMKESYCKGSNDPIRQPCREQYEALVLELRDGHKTNARQIQASFDCEISRQKEIFSEALKSGEDALRRKNAEIIKMKEKQEDEIHRMIDSFGLKIQRLESKFENAQESREASLSQHHDAALAKLRKEYEAKLSKRGCKIKEYAELCRKNKELAENYRRSYEGALKMNAAVLADSEKDQTNVIRCDGKVVYRQNALLCCNICCDRYNDGSNTTSGEDDRRPVIMPGDCGRSICKSCAEKDRAAKIDGLPGNAKMIQCMFCRSKYHSEKHVFPINRDLMALL